MRNAVTITITVTSLVHPRLTGRTPNPRHNNTKKTGPYPTFNGSPASKGQLQFDLWGVKPTMDWDWAGLKKNIMKHGMRNSLLIATMPTASSATILGTVHMMETHSTSQPASQSVAC